MSDINKNIDAMVDAFLSGGGTVTKLPETLPATPEDVLLYLQNQEVDVRAVPETTASPRRRFICEGKSITLKALVELANRHRRKQRMVPFEIHG